MTLTLELCRVSTRSRTWGSSSSALSTRSPRVKEGANFIDYDVEIIYKERGKDYFETVYVREKARKVFDKINDKQLKALRKLCKVKNDFIKVEKNGNDAEKS